MILHPAALLAAALLAASCAPAAQNAGEAHDERLATEAAVTAALNKPGGADYPAAIAAVERDDRPATNGDLAIGNIILTACRNAAAFCTAPNDAAAGLRRLAAAAAASGEDGLIAAGHLGTWYERGAGPTLPPDPARAACWSRVGAGEAAAATCDR